MPRIASTMAETGTVVVVVVVMVVVGGAGSSRMARKAAVPTSSANAARAAADAAALTRPLTQFPLISLGSMSQSARKLNTSENASSSLRSPELTAWASLPARHSAWSFDRPRLLS